MDRRGLLRSAELDPAAIPEQQLKETVVWTYWELTGAEMVKGEEPEMDAFLDCLGEQDVELRPRPASMVRWTIGRFTLPASAG